MTAPDDLTPPEPILEPGLPIIDPHHHLWDRTALVPTLPPVTHEFDRILRKTPRYLLDELQKDARSGHDIKATVYVECGYAYRVDGPVALQPVGEVEFVNAVAVASASGQQADFRACAGIVGHADLMLGDAVAEVLEAEIAAAPERFRGVRYSASWDADPAVLGPLGRRPQGVFGAEAFRRGFARLAPLGLSFDAWLLEPQLEDVIDLSRAFPDTSIILDHVGTPLGLGAYAGKLEERFATWADRIGDLAKSPNVVVKLGGLGMPFNGMDYTGGPTSEQLAAQWRPYIELCIEAFGVDRCMFESNFPVDFYGCDYATLWNAFKRIAAGASVDEKAALFYGTAARIYRIGG